MGSNTEHERSWRYLAVVVGLAAILWGLGKCIPETAWSASSPQDTWIVPAFLITLVLVVVGLSCIQLWKSGRKVWEPLQTDRIRWSACLDTVLISLAYMVLMGWTTQQGIMIALPLVFGGCIILSHVRAGVHTSIRELLAFYGTISMWNVLTFRVPHDRLHPHCDCHGPWDEEPVPPIKNVKDVFFLVLGNTILFPAVLSTILVKASSLFLFPLLYMALSFDARDYLNLSLEAKKRWRSSFRVVWIVLALFSLAIFGLKVLIYAQWNAVATYWNASDVCRIIEQPLAPRHFYVWHITLALNALVVLVVTWLVDHTVHLLADRHVPPGQMTFRLKAIRFLFRTRTVLSVYNWMCLTALTLPFLRGAQLPGITWVVFPQNPGTPY